MRRADRLLQLVELLRSARISTGRSLAAALEISVRTVYRDMAALSAMGIPVRGEAGVGYVLDHGYFLPPLSLTSEEAEALALGAEILEHWSDGPLSQQARSALRKVRAVTPRQALGGIDRGILWAPRWVSRHPPKADLLSLKRAAEDRQVLRIAYTSLAGTFSERLVRPLALGFFGQVWLLIAYCELRADFRCFRIDRIERAERTGRTFRNEAGKQLADFKQAKGEAALRLAMAAPAASA